MREKMSQNHYYVEIFQTLYIKSTLNDLQFGTKLET